MLYIFAVVLIILWLLKMLNSYIRKQNVKRIGYTNRVIAYGHSDIIEAKEEKGSLRLFQNIVKETKSILFDQNRNDKGTTENITAIRMDERKTQNTIDSKYQDGRIYNKNDFSEIFENK